MKKRIAIALACYAALAVVASVMVDGAVRIALWIFFIGIAVKTLIHSNDPDMD